MSLNLVVKHFTKWPLFTTIGLAITFGLHFSADAGSGNGGSSAVANPNPSPSPSVGVVTTNHQGVFTVHYDFQRTGVNPAETILTPANVGPGSFGKLKTFLTDAYTIAQPLYVTNVTVNGYANPMNVIYVATELDSVYAFDASGTTTTSLWEQHFASINSPASMPPTATDVPVAGGCPDIAPQAVVSSAPTPMPAYGAPGTTWGITGTPVIDPTTETLYVVTATKDTTVKPTAFHSKLHALDIKSGAEKFGGPVEITGANFNAQISNQREGLALTPDGHLVVAFSSQCDTGPYAGFVFTFNKTTLAKVSEFQTAGNITAAQSSLDGQKTLGGAGIWSLGTGPAMDTTGNLFFSTGNGVFDCDPSNSSNNQCSNFGCSVLKVTSAGGILARNDYFTPADQANMNTLQVDLDVGSGGTIVLPDMTDSSGSVEHLLVAGGKSGQIYLVNRDNMGKYNAADYTFSNIVQSFNLNGQAFAQNGVYYSITDGLYGTPTYFNGRVYFAPVGDGVKAYQMTNARFVTPAGTPAGMMTAVDQTDWTFGWPGGTPVISANGTSDAILWFIDTSRGNSYPPAATEATLYAYDATHMSYAAGRSNNGMLFSSDLSTRDANGNPAPNPNDVAGDAVKHQQPTVYNGHVYIATRTEIDMYGLTGDTPIAPPTPLPIVVAAATTGATVTLNYDAATSMSTGCPASFVPTNEYGFIIQLCDSPFSDQCTTSGVISNPGVISYLDKFVNLPPSTTAAPITYQIPLDANSSKTIGGGQYEILPGTNIFTIPGVSGTPTLTIENPAPFTVDTGFTPVTVDFYVNCGQ
jgi:hypothetical protein